MAEEEEVVKRLGCNFGSIGVVNLDIPIFVDYAGNVLDWEKIKYLSRKYNFFSINDNCHALGSKYKNSCKYALKYADIVIQSFHPAKNITTGEGGAVLSNDKYRGIRIN